MPSAKAEAGIDLQAGEAHVFNKGNKRRNCAHVNRAAVQALQGWHSAADSNRLGLQPG